MTLFLIRYRGQYHLARPGVFGLKWRDVCALRQAVPTEEEGDERDFYMGWADRYDDSVICLADQPDHIQPLEEDDPKPSALPYDQLRAMLQDLPSNELLAALCQMVGLSATKLQTENGWRTWDAGSQYPFIEPGAHVDVELRNGTIIHDRIVNSLVWRWGMDSSTLKPEAEIVRWRRASLDADESA